MRADLTDITLVVDRSGSMSNVRDDAEGGINEFISSQGREPGDAFLTLVQFDTDYEFVHRGVPIREVPKYQLQPRGMTALLDAVGRAVNETGARLAAMDEANRPGLVIFVVMTDGLENSSHEFTRATIKEMIERQQNVYNWHFTFLGANQDAFAEAQSLGINPSGAADYAVGKERAAMSATIGKMGRMRAAVQCGQPADNAFTELERQHMK